MITCRHVVDDVGGDGNVNIAGEFAEVVNIGVGSQDFAILKVKKLEDANPLPIAMVFNPSSDFCTVGFSMFDKKDQQLTCAYLIGSLKVIAFLKFKQEVKTVPGWKLIINAEEDLKPGFSGSPIIDKKTRLVIGIITHRDKGGREGAAISINILPSIWKDMPDNIMRNRSYNLVELKNKIKNNFLSQTGVVREEFYLLLSRFNIDDVLLFKELEFFPLLESLINYCHRENKCEELEHYVD